MEKILAKTGTEKRRFRSAAIGAAVLLAGLTGTLRASACDMEDSVWPGAACKYYSASAGGDDFFQPNVSTALRNNYTSNRTAVCPIARIRSNFWMDYGHLVVSGSSWTVSGCNWHARSWDGSSLWTAASPRLAATPNGEDYLWGLFYPGDYAASTFVCSVPPGEKIYKYGTAECLNW